MQHNQKKAGVILSYIAMALNYTILLFYTPIMLKLLGQSEFGLYNLVSSIVGYLGLLSLGLGSAYLRFFYKFKKNDDEEGLARLNGMFMTFYLIVSILAIIAGIIISNYSELIFSGKITSEEAAKTKWLVLIITLNLATTFPMSLFSSYVSANEKYVFQQIAVIIKTILSPFITLPLLLFGYASIGLAIGMILTNIIIEIIIMIYSFSKLKIKFSFKKFDNKLIKEIVVFSSFLFIDIVIGKLNNGIDNYIIGYYHGTVSVALYGVAYQIQVVYESFAYNINNVFRPQVHKLILEDDNLETNEDVLDLFIKVGRIQFMVLMLLLTGLLFFGKRFIILWLGIEYEKSYAIMMIVIAPVTIPLIQNLGHEILKAKNKHKFRSITYFIIAILNIILSIPLTKKYGGLGASIGTAVALMFGNFIMMNIYYYSKIKLNVIKFWKEITKLVLSMMPSILIGFLITHYFDIENIFIYLISITIYTVVYIVFVFVFGMNLFEKQLIKDVIKKAIPKSNKHNIKY